MEINGLNEIANPSNAQTRDLLSRLRSAGSVEAVVVKLLQSQMLLSSRLGQILARNQLGFKPGDQLTIRLDESGPESVLKVKRDVPAPMRLEAANVPQLRSLLDAQLPRLAEIIRLLPGRTEIKLAAQSIELPQRLPYLERQLISLARDVQRNTIEIQPLDKKELYKALVRQLLPQQLAEQITSPVRLLGLLQRASRAAVSAPKSDVMRESRVGETTRATTTEIKPGRAGDAQFASSSKPAVKTAPSSSSPMTRSLDFNAPMQKLALKHSEPKTMPAIRRSESTATSKTASPGTATRINSTSTAPATSTPIPTEVTSTTAQPLKTPPAMPAQAVNISLPAAVLQPNPSLMQPSETTGTNPQVAKPPQSTDLSQRPTGNSEPALTPRPITNQPNPTAQSHTRALTTNPLKPQTGTDAYLTHRTQTGTDANTRNQTQNAPSSTSAGTDADQKILPRTGTDAHKRSQTQNAPSGASSGTDALTKHVRPAKRTETDNHVRAPQSATNLNSLAAPKTAPQQLMPSTVNPREGATASVLAALMRQIPDLAQFDTMRLLRWFEFSGLIRTPPAISGSPPQPAIADLLAQMSEPDALGRELRQQQSAPGQNVHRQTTTPADVWQAQLGESIKLIEQSLTQSLLTRATLGLQHEAQQPLSLSFAVPLLEAHEVKPLYIELQQRDRTAEGADTCWDLRLSFDFTELGPITCHLFLQGNAVAASFYSDLPTTQKTIDAALPGLDRQLQLAGFNPGNLHSFSAMQAPASKIQAANPDESLIDIEV